MFLYEHQRNCGGQDLNLQEVLICDFFFCSSVNCADTVSLCGIKHKQAGESDVTWCGVSQQLNVIE